MIQDLQDLLRQLEAIKAEGHALCAGLTESQFNWRPAPKRWSIAECLVHLNVAVTRTLPAFDRAIEVGRGKGLTAEGPFRYSWFANWMVASMEPPPKRRMKTFGIFEVPEGAHALARVLPEFMAVRDQLADRVRRSDGLDLKRVRVVSPVTRLLRLPLGAYLRFVIAHDRRHLWQAKQVRHTPGFGLAVSASGQV
jgi:DinB superfamily